MRDTIDLSLLRQAPLRRLLAAQWASLSGDYAMLAALPFVVFAIGGGIAEVGLAFAAAVLSFVCMVLWGGVLADRHGRRRMMLIAESGRMVTQGAFALSFLFGTAHYWQVLGAEVAIGAGAALAQPALTGLVTEVVEPRELQSANALRGMLGAVAMLSGPALAGAALFLAGPGAAVALDASSFALSAWLLLRLSPRFGTPGDRPGGSLRTELRIGWTEFSSRTWLWVMVAEFALFNMLVFGPFEVLGAQIAHRSLGGAGAWSAILAAFGLGQIAGALIALAWRRPARPLLAVALLVLAWVPLLVLLGADAPLGAIMAGAALTGTGWLLLTAIWEATFQGLVPPAQLSRVSSYDWLGATALMPVGLGLAAPVGAALGAGAALLLAAFVVVLLTVAVLAVPSIRLMGAPAPESAEPVRGEQPHPPAERRPAALGLHQVAGRRDH